MNPLPSIVHVIVRLDTGGAERSLERLVRHTHTEYAHHVICFGVPTTLGERIARVSDNVRVSYLDMRLGPIALTQARSLVRQTQPDIIQGWMYYGNVLASLLGKGSSRPKIAWNIRQSPANFAAEKRQTRWAMQLARLSMFTPDLVIYNSYAGQRSHEHLGYNAYPNRVITNGIDTEHFARRSESRELTREKLGVDPHVRLVGLVCRYHPLKGTQLFLAACAQLTNQDGQPLRIVLAGTGHDANNTHLQAQIEKLALKEVMLQGEVECVPEFLSALDLVVIPSLREGTPNVLLEAMACETAVVATRVGDVERILSDTKRLADPGDIQDLADKMSYALKQPEAFGAGDRAIIQASYHIDRCIQDYRSSYAELLTA